MHALALAVIPPEGDPDEAVAKVMAPYYEEANPEGWWDWWQIGGRFTGTLTDYDPSADPANIEVCDLCGGTGTRGDMVVENGCNGCLGTGRRVNWPTDWKRYSGDVLSAAEAAVVPDLNCYTLVYPEGFEHRLGGGWGPVDEADNAKWVASLRAAFARLGTDARVAVVDYHS